MNNRFFKLHRNLSIYKVLKFLKVEESFFYKYNDFSDDITNFEIKKFSSFVLCLGIVIYRKVKFYKLYFNIFL